MGRRNHRFHWFIDFYSIPNNVCLCYFEANFRFQFKIVEPHTKLLIACSNVWLTYLYRFRPQSQNAVHFPWQTACTLNSLMELFIRAVFTNEINYADGVENKFFLRLLVGLNTSIERDSTASRRWSRECLSRSASGVRCAHRSARIIQSKQIESEAIFCRPLIIYHINKW